MTAEESEEIQAKLDWLRNNWTVGPHQDQCDCSSRGNPVAFGSHDGCPAGIALAFGEALLEAREALRAVEWKGDCDGWQVCPSCHGEDRVHIAGCPIDQVLNR